MKLRRIAVEPARLFVGPTLQGGIDQGPEALELSGCQNAATAG